MNKLRLVILSLFLLGFQGLHKYYVSVTDIKIIESSGTIQVTTRIFIDDLELALQNIGNDESLRLSDNDSDEIKELMKVYMKSHFKIYINDKPANLSYLGREYEDDVVYVYMEIAHLKTVSNLEIQNSILFETYEEQEHIIKTKSEQGAKSFILNKSNPSKVLNI